MLDSIGIMELQKRVKELEEKCDKLNVDMETRLGKVIMYCEDSIKSMNQKWNSRGTLVNMRLSTIEQTLGVKGKEEEEVIVWDKDTQSLVEHLLEILKKKQIKGGRNG